MPYYNDIPDLSHWRSVSEFLVIEAALLLAGVDPLDHEAVVQGRRDMDPHHRRKLFKGMERAIVTAISRGTLSTVKARTSQYDDNGNRYSFSFDPTSHTWADIDSRETIITRQSLLSWIAKEGVDFARPAPVAIPPWEGEVVNDVQGIAQQSDSRSRPPQAEVLLIENKPSFLDPDNEMSPIELRAAASCWEAITVDGDPSKWGKSILGVAKEWLQNHRSDYDNLSNEAIERVAKVVNWNKKGGAPKSQAKPTHPQEPHES